MKLKYATFLGLLGCLACTANQAQPVFIQSFFPLAPMCSIDVDDSILAGNGYLDVAADGAQFFLGVRLAGGDNVTQRPLVVSGTTIERENRDAPLITQQVVTYRLSRRLGATLKPFVTNLTLPFSEAGKAKGAVQLISSDLATQLYDGLTPSDTIDDYVDIQADVEFRGQYSNSKTPFTTGVMTFPIRAFRSNPQPCTNGYARFPISADAGAPDLCNYVGQSNTQLIAPFQPSCCPAVGAPGC